MVIVAVPSIDVGDHPGVRDVRSIVLDGLVLRGTGQVQGGQTVAADKVSASMLTIH